MFADESFAQAAKSAAQLTDEDVNKLRDAARKLGWRSMRENAWQKVQRGLIPISEQERWRRMIVPAVLRTKG